MSRHLTATLAGYAVLLAGWSALRAVAGRGPQPALLASLAFLELALVIAAVVEALRLLSGGRAAEPATHAGYLAASVLVLPLVASNLSPRRERFDAAILATGALAVAVVVLRLRVTG